MNAVLAEARTRTRRRTRAIIIYPMNALANSQLEELDKFVKNVPGERPVAFARYTGQEDSEDRRRISEDPPDILLTNFMMLELLMTRQDDLDRRVIGNCAGLRFLVLDELHTYRGRQGADVALLVRRVRERLSPEKLQCIGTSATMASEGSLEDKARVVARVASKLFSIEIPESNVIVETLERVTDSARNATSVRAALGPAIDAGLASTISDAELRIHPLTIWVETRLGVTWSEIDQRWARARPLTVEEAATRLSEESGRDVSACRSALRSLLLVSGIPERGRTGSTDASTRSFFAFKLHQFISGAGHAYATLEAPGQRTVTVEGQQITWQQDNRRGERTVEVSELKGRHLIGVFGPDFDVNTIELTQDDDVTECVSTTRYTRRRLQQLFRGKPPALHGLEKEVSVLIHACNVGATSSPKHYWNGDPSRLMPQFLRNSYKPAEGFWTEEQYAGIKPFAVKSRLDHMAVYVHSGPRHEELYLLDPRRFDEVNRRIWCEGTKTDKSKRYLQLWGEGFEVVKRRVALYGNGPHFSTHPKTGAVFPQIFPDYWARSRVSQDMKKACKRAAKAGVFTPQIACNGWRRTFATWCGEHGVDEAVTCTWMGHTDNKMVRRVYQALTEKRSSAQSRKLEAGFNAALTAASAPVVKLHSNQGES